MTALSIILLKVIVKQFYQLNSGFFLVVFFLGFGIQQPPSFLISPAFLTSAVATPQFVGAVLVLFTLYYLKSFNFISKTLALPENEYLYVAGVFPRQILWKAFGLVHVQLFLPALAYTVLMGFYSFIGGLDWELFLLVVYNLILLGYTIHYFSIRLRQTIPGSWTPLFFTTTERKLFAHPVWWPLRYLLRQEKAMVILTKMLGLSILYGFMALYPYPSYGLRPTLVGFLMAVTVQAILVQQIQVFQETHLAFLRQLPYPIYQRFGRQLVLFALLLLPEMVLVGRFTFYSATLLSLISLYALGVSIFTLFQALLYGLAFNQTAYIRSVFFLFIGLLLVLLWYPPLYLLAGLLLLLAFLLFQRYYYRYELTEN